jgi:hypothetical protein
MNRIIIRAIVAAGDLYDWARWRLTLRRSSLPKGWRR